MGGPEGPLLLGPAARPKRCMVGGRARPAAALGAAARPRPVALACATHGSALAASPRCAGALGRLVLPATRTLALVEYLESQASPQLGLAVLHGLPAHRLRCQEQRQRARLCTPSSSAPVASHCFYHHGVRTGKRCQAHAERCACRQALPLPALTQRPRAALQDARRAFKALAYKRFQHVPLYLEWAPKGIFSSPPPPRPAPCVAVAAAAGSGKSGSGKAAAGGGKAAAGGGKDGAAAGELLTGLAEAQADDVESSSIFVKNLAWGTGEAALKAHFDAAVSAAGAHQRGEGRVAAGDASWRDFVMLEVGEGILCCAAPEGLHELSLQAPHGGAACLLAGCQADASWLRGMPRRHLSRSLATPSAAWPTLLHSGLPGAPPPHAGGSVRSVKVAKKKGPDGKVLSAGFGFVECSSEAAAKVAVKTLQGSALDGHKLVLQLSTKKGGTASAAGAAGKPTKPKLPDTSKLVVRNVAFEATRKDILGLFTPFGAVKSCRLPRKFDGTHR